MCGPETQDLPKVSSGAPRPVFDPQILSLALGRGWTPKSLLALGARGENDVVVFPMRDASGLSIGERRRRANNSTFPDGSKSRINAGGKMGLICPWPVPAGDPVLVLEGEADAAAVLSAGWSAVVGLPSANSSQAVIEALGAMLAGRQVVLFPDPDLPGQNLMRKIERALAEAECVVLTVPPVDDKDLDARLQSVAPEARAALLRSLVESATPSIDDTLFFPPFGLSTPVLADVAEASEASEASGASAVSDSSGASGASGASDRHGAYDSQRTGAPGQSIGELDDAVRKAIEASLPSGEGEREGKIFTFVRHLKDIPALREQKAVELRPIMRLWFDRALPFISTKDFEKSRDAFSRAWNRVKFSISESGLRLALEKAKRLNVVEADLYESAQRRLFIQFLAQLQLDAGPGRPFFLSQKAAADLFESERNEISRWLASACSDEIIRLHAASRHRKAAEYVFVRLAGMVPDVEAAREARGPSVRVPSTPPSSPPMRRAPPALPSRPPPRPPSIGPLPKIETERPGNPGPLPEYPPDWDEWNEGDEDTQG